MNLEDEQKKMSERQPEPSPDSWLTVSMVARKWKMSPESASAILQRYRGRQGFLDAGSHGDLKRTHARPRDHSRLASTAESHRRRSAKVMSYPVVP
jgi:hypothetical protein